MKYSGKNVNKAYFFHCFIVIQHDIIWKDLLFCVLQVPNELFRQTCNKAYFSTALLLFNMT